MFKQKSHFNYSKNQRKGIFVLIFLVIVFQAVLLFSKFKSEKTYRLDKISKELQYQLDSLTKESPNKKKNYTFNPNYLSDYKAYQLGMSVPEIDRLLTYRKSGKYVNSSKDFQKVTQVSDSLLKAIAPYFKFPDWIEKKNTKAKASKTKKIVVKDINKATIEQLIKINGIAQKRAETILKYRELLGGFTFNIQLSEVWGIPPDVLQRLQIEFKVLSKPNISKINVNKTTAYELSKIVYIDYKLAKLITDYKKEVAEIQNLAELKTISNFPVDKFDLISLYLQAK